MYGEVYEEERSKWRALFCKIKDDAVDDVEDDTEDDAEDDAVVDAVG